MPYILVALSAWALSGLFYTSSLTMPPAAYHMPQILAVLVSVLAVMMVVDVFLYKRRKQSEEATDEATDATADNTAPYIGGFFDGMNVPRTAAFMAMVVLYILLLESVGYFIMTPLFLVGTLSLLRGTRPWIIIVISVVAPMIVYFIFVTFLDLPMPMGLMK
jgi:putative tricarboxylic transport membrane protein